MKRTRSVSQPTLGSRAPIVSFVAALGVLTFAASTAQAQPIRPNILVVFDTSTSMLEMNADGSPLCDNRGTAAASFA